MLSLGEICDTLWNVAIHTWYAVFLFKCKECWTQPPLVHNDLSIHVFLADDKMANISLDVHLVIYIHCLKTPKILFAILTWLHFPLVKSVSCIIFSRKICDICHYLDRKVAVVLQWLLSEWITSLLLGMLGEAVKNPEMAQRYVNTHTHTPTQHTRVQKHILFKNFSHVS